MEIGPTALRSYRQERNLSCAEFAAQLGIAEPTLRSLENGTRSITPERAIEIEERTRGHLTREKLRPDIFGEPPGKPEAAGGGGFGKRNGKAVSV